MGRVVGYSVLAFLRMVPSSLRRGYVASRIGSCSLIGFSKLLGVTMNRNSDRGGIEDDLGDINGVMVCFVMLSFLSLLVASL